MKVGFGRAKKAHRMWIFGKNHEVKRFHLSKKYSCGQFISRYNSLGIPYIIGYICLLHYEKN